MEYKKEEVSLTYEQELEEYQYEKENASFPLYSLR
mgnify:CR=1 FL=1